EGRFTGKLPVFRAVDNLGGNPIIGVLSLRIKHAEAEPRAKYRRQFPVNFLSGDEPLLHGVKQRFILRAAIQPHTCLDSQRGGLSLGSDNLMARVQVGNRPAVAYNVSLKTPLISQNVSKEGVAGTARLTVRAVIGAHHRLHSGVDQSFEGR